MLASVGERMEVTPCVIHVIGGAIVIYNFDHYFVAVGEAFWPANEAFSCKREVLNCKFAGFRWAKEESIG